MLQLNQFFIYLDKEINNYADYETKHHTTSHHRNVRPNRILNGHHVTHTSQNNISHLITLKPERYVCVKMWLSIGTSTLPKELHTSTGIRQKYPLQFRIEKSLTDIFYNSSGRIIKLLQLGVPPLPFW